MPDGESKNPCSFSFGLFYSSFILQFFYLWLAVAEAFQDLVGVLTWKWADASNGWRRVREFERVADLGDFPQGGMVYLHYHLPVSQLRIYQRRNQP